MSTLVAVFLLACIVLAFGALLLVISGSLGPKKTITAAKMMPYECGIPGEETKDSKVSVKFYLTAILFIIFDIEIIFMFPWAITFVDAIQKGYGSLFLFSMIIFILVFVVGLIWEIKSRALDWN